jgi:putative ABC transport system ATP-binding protein
LEELQGEGATICMVTHDPRYAHVAERMIHLFDGQIVSEEDAFKMAAMERSEFGTLFGTIS